LFSAGDPVTASRQIGSHPRSSSSSAKAQSYQEISRQEAIDHWRDAMSRIVPPVAVSLDLLGGGAGWNF
jgi:hypothetical protein